MAVSNAPGKLAGTSWGPVTYTKRGRVVVATYDGQDCTVESDGHALRLAATRAVEWPPEDDGAAREDPRLEERLRAVAAGRDEVLVVEPTQDRSGVVATVWVDADTSDAALAGAVRTACHAAMAGADAARGLALSLEVEAQLRALAEGEPEPIASATAPPAATAPAPAAPTPAAPGPAPAATAPRWCYVETPVDLRDSAGAAAGRLEPGQWYQALREASGWVEVSLENGSRGWAPAQSLRYATPAG